MEAISWIEEQSACQASGVSRTTLLRFAEAGYLKTKQSNNGTVLYSPDEISQVFGIEIPRASTLETVPQKDTFVGAASTSKSTAAQVEVAEENPLRDFIRSPSLAAKVTIEKNTTETTPDVTVSTPSIENTDKPFEMQRQKLTGVIELLERILESKDAEIEDLRQQRSWLKERVQRLEEKSDRDQLLLLAETQTLRRMIEIQSPKKSLVERTLTALGFLPPPEETRNTENRKTVDQ